MPVELRKRKAPVAPAPVPEKPTKAARGGGGADATPVIPVAAAPASAQFKARAAKAAKAANAKAVDPAPAVATIGTNTTNNEELPAAAPEPATTTTTTISTTTVATSSKPSPGGEKPVVGQVIDLEGFGGTIQDNDGQETSLKTLVDASKAGVCIFTYPKANTPGCTKQACLFRDSYEDLTAAGLAVYGLSGDSPKFNTSFKEKQRLPYPLLCDPGFSLSGALGLKKAPKSTTRGVFVIDRAGKVLALEAGGPDATLAVAKRAAGELASGSNVGESIHKAEGDEAGGSAAKAAAVVDEPGQASKDEAEAGANDTADKAGEVAANGPNAGEGVAGEEKTE